MIGGEDVCGHRYIECVCVSKCVSESVEKDNLLLLTKKHKWVLCCRTIKCMFEFSLIFFFHWKLIDN